MNKRGLSQIVNVMLLVLLSLIALATIWVIFSHFISQTTSKFNTDRFTLNLKIKSAKINFTTGIATVQVTREPGAGNLTEIKFVVEDNKNSEVFSFPVTNFDELVSRTFTLNLTERPDLVLDKIYKISIAPVYLSGSGGTNILGSITDSVGGLNININSTQNQTSPIATCKVNSDCGTDYFIPNSGICSQDGLTVLASEEVFTCSLGFCESNLKTLVNQTCASDETCYQGACVTKTANCTNQTITTDCGVDGYIGTPTCDTTAGPVSQDYRSYSCVLGQCQSSDVINTVQNCSTNETCYGGACFVPLECVSDSDCNACQICDSGTCVKETILNNGTVRSTWPYGIGEYFDSFDLPTAAGSALTGDYILFPNSTQKGCLKIRENVLPPQFSGLISYVRLNESKTNVSDNDSYQVWKTTCAC